MIPQFLLDTLIGLAPDDREDVINWLLDTPGSTISNDIWEIVAPEYEAEA